MHIADLSALPAFRAELKLFALGETVTDGLVTGTIKQIDEGRALYLVEYQLWPNEPLRTVWRQGDTLRSVGKRANAWSVT